MLEKIGHIKNPLTVIAMFACIAEVSGAGCLPFLEKEVQETYVWFLMGFPCLLVLLFFGTLWTNHTVLYAPGDFKNENIFNELFRSNQPKYGPLDYNAYKEVAPDIVADLAEEAKSHPEQEESTLGDPPDFEPAPIVHSGSDVASVIRGHMIEKFIRFGEYKEEVAKKLQQQFNAPYRLSESPKTMPNAVFDVVLSRGDRNLVGKIMFVTSGTMQLQLDVAKDWIRTVSMFRDTLEPNEALKLLGVICIVYKRSNLTDGELSEMEQAIHDTSLMFPFTVQTQRYDLETLISGSYISYALT